MENGDAGVQGAASLHAAIPGTAHNCKYPLVNLPWHSLNLYLSQRRCSSQRLATPEGPVRSWQARVGQARQWSFGS